MGNARAGDKVTHQDKQRQNRKIINKDRINCRIANASECGLKPYIVSETDRTDDCHTERDRYLQEQQDEKRGEAY